MDYLIILWAGSTAGLIFIHVLRYLRLGLPGENDPQPTYDKPLPPLSVIISARNEEQNLLRNLPEVLQQDYARFEVLVVDDRSTDGTLAVLEGLEKRFPHLRILRRRRPQDDYGSGKKAALSMAIDQARHEKLVFTDADCRPCSPYWLLYMGNAFRTHSLVLGFGRLSGKGSLGQLVSFETIQTALHYMAAALKGQPYMGVGRNMGYSRDLFATTDGHARHADLPSGDDDLFVVAASRHASTTILTHPHSFTESPAPQSWKYWWRQKQRHYSTAWRYPRGIASALLGEGILQGLFYILLPFALPSSFPWLVLSLVGIRLLLEFRMVSWARHLQGSPKFWWTFPLWEFIWVIGTFAIHMVQMFTRPRQW